MNVFDYFNRNDSFKISRESIERTKAKAFNLPIEEESVKQEAVDSLTYDEKNELGTSIVAKVCEWLNINDDPSLIQRIAINCVSAVYFFSDSRFIRKNDLVTVDAQLLCGIACVDRISCSDLKCTERVINDFEQILLSSLSEIHNISKSNIYNLYEDRKKLFLRYLEYANYDTFIEQAALLLGNDINSQSFESFREDSPIGILDIFDSNQITLEIMTLIKTVNEMNEQWIRTFSDDMYESQISVEAEITELFCKKCGKKIPLDSDFCMFCGTKVTRDNARKWPQGIPNYTQNDLMTEQEVFEFALNYILEDLEKEGHQIQSCSNKMQNIPTLVTKKDGKLTFILVETDVAPHIPKLSSERRGEFVRHASKFHAMAKYASVSIGATDSERFESGIALRNDSYYVRFTGYENVIYM